MTGVQTCALPIYGVKTEESDRVVTANWVDLHLQIGIEAMTELGQKGEKIKHFRY